jgi:glycosyltransferase involved in cell wall biosynthesis
MLPEISVIITTYNSSATLERLLQSVLGQVGLGEHFNLEVIVVDDCSTDDTRNIAQRFGVTLIAQPYNSGGPNKGRNVGLGLMKGQFFTIVDHDDEWLPSRIMDVFHVLGKHDVISGGFILRHAVQGTERYVGCSGSEEHYPCNVTFLAKLRRDLKMQNVYMGGLLISANLRHVLFEEEHGKLDYDWLLRLFHNRDGYEVRKPLFLRHVDGSNLSLNEQYRLVDYQFNRRFVEQIRMEYPSEVKLCIKRLSGSLARYYYVMNSMREARKYFRKAELTWVNVAYYLTSFWGSSIVKRYVRVFG